MNRVLTFLVAGLLASPAMAADWEMQPAASRLDFAATFEGNPAPGTFRQFDARLRLDPGKPEGGRLDVVVQTGSADMQSAEINQAIAGPEWFDVARHPKAEFHSTEIVSAGPGSYVARGTLALKGVSRNVDVPFRWTATGAEARMVGELVVPRAEFGIGTGRWAATKVIGPDVSIRFNVVLRRAGG